MARLSLFRRIRSGYILSVLLLLISYLLIFYVQQRLVNEAGWVTHSYSVVQNAESLKGLLTEAETGVRGYVITKDERFLKPYYGAIKKIPELSNELKTLTADNTEQQGRVDTLIRISQRKMDMMETGLINFKVNGLTTELTEEVKRRREISLNIMDSMRLYIAKVTEADKN